MDNKVMRVVDLPERLQPRAVWVMPQGLEGPPACGIKARRFERQMGVRKSTTTTTAHEKAARRNEAQLCSLLHADHYKA
jgi:hypothetical protein